MSHSNCKCDHGAPSDPWSINSVNKASQVKSYPVQPTPEMFLQQSGGQQVGGSGIVYQPGVAPPPQQTARLVPANFHDAISALSVEALEQIVLNNPSVVNERGFNGVYPLHRATLRGDPSVVKMLLRYKANPNALNEFDETPLHFACKRGNIMILSLLLEGGADVRAEDRAGKGALHHTAHGGSVMAAHYLMEVCGLTGGARDRNLSTPMHIICAHGHVEAFDYFSKKERSSGFDKDAQGNTLLHVAALCGSGLMCFKLLQRHGYKLLREINSEGCTALDLAKRGVQPKFRDIVRMLEFYTSKTSRTGVIKGPVLAWYGLLILPILMYPVTLMFAGLFESGGLVTLAGVVAMVALRFGHSHRMNHLSRWPSPAHAGLFFAGMLYTMLCFYVILLPYAYAASPCLVYVSFFLTATMSYLYAILLKRDPGMVREPRRKNTEMQGYYSIADVATGLIKPMEFCSKCEMVPGPLTSHCKLCDLCFHEVDHHCLYLYRCIAAHNHRLFIVFNVVVMTSMSLFEYASIIYVQAIYPGRAFDWGLAGELFSFHPAVWSLFVLNGMSIVWGVWLLRVQLQVIAVGKALAYQPHHAGRSHLTLKQKLMNIVRFMLTRSPSYYSDSVISA